MTQYHALVEQLHLICQDVLGRVPTTTELGAWRNRVHGGMTVAQVRQQLARSPEARLAYFLAGVASPRMTPEIQKEALARVRKGVPVETIVRDVNAKLATGWPPAPSPRPALGSRAARGYRTPAPGCA